VYNHKLFLLKIIHWRPDQDLTTGKFKDVGHFSPCFSPFGKAGGLQILCCQGFAVEVYDFTLDASAQKPSDFCNDRVKMLFFPGRLHR
jgi:hypothetical protein